MDAQTLIDRIRSAREVWLQLEPAVAPAGEDDVGTPAKRVKVRRPAEAEMNGVLKGTRLDGATFVVVGWDGFRECDLLPAGVGGSDAVPFHPDLWAEVLKDHVKWVPLVHDKATSLVLAHIEHREEAAKNSPPSSTPSLASNGTAKTDPT